MRMASKICRGWLLLLFLCLTAPAAFSQTANQDMGQFQGHGDIGTILHPGSEQYDASTGRYSVTGSGANLWFGIDDFHFVWKKMSGDLAFSADIDFVGDKGNAHRKAVLMVRQSLDPHSIYADVARHGDGLTSLQYRDTAGDETHEVETYAKGPHRVRIDKRGDYAYVFVPDADGTMVFSGAAIRVSITGDFYIGLGVCSHDGNVTETAVFSNVKIEALPPATGRPVLYSTLESVLIASTDRRVRYTAPIHFENPNWTPDGKALIFDQDGTLQRFPLDNGVHPIDSTVPRSTASMPVATSPETQLNGNHGISPDGGSIAIGNRDPDGQERIYVVPAAGGTPRRVTAQGPAFFYGWSPDGKIISYGTPHGSTSNAYIVPAAGGAPRLLAAGSEGAEFSSDGQWIYFQSDRSGHMQVWRMHPDGTAQQQLVTSETSDLSPHVSPDGTMVAYLAYKQGMQGSPVNRDVEIRVLSLASGKVRTLTKLLGGRGTMDVPCWSPDSTMLAFTSYELLPR